MKLIEILARDLKEWPEGTDDLYLETAEDFQTAIVTKEQWKEERAKLEKEHTCFSTFPKPGERCKVRIDLDGNAAWVPCYIVGMDDQGFCVYSLPNILSDQTGMPYDGAPSPDCFAPLSEKDKEVAKAVDVIYEITKDRNKTAEVVQALYGDSWIGQR